MEYPELGALVTTDQALDLCRHFELDYLIDRIANHPDSTFRGNLTDARVFPTKSWGFSRPATGGISPINAACPMIFVMDMGNRETTSSENGSM